MKKVILLSHLLIVSIFTAATAQSRLDTIILYKAVVKHMHLDKSVKSVISTTNKQLYHNINLFNPSYNTLDTITTKFWHQKAWADFLTKIDTSAINDYTLKTGNKLWFKNFKPSDNKNVVISFSPIAFNDRNSKAVFVMRYSSGSSGGAIVSAFFEKLNDVWVIKDVLQLALLD